MSDHLPWINHLAAREAGKGLVEFSQLPDAEQAEWVRFTLEGPSRLRDSIHIAQLRNMFRDFLSGAKKFTPVDEAWLDGVQEHPESAWESRVRETVARRKADRIKSARALHEREQAAGK